jgi:hypothetical protein
MYGLLAVEPTEWNAWAILALIVTNAGTLYKLIKSEKRTDAEQDHGRDDTLVGQWRAWGKAMEKGRNDSVKRQLDAEDRERKLIAEVSRLAECVRQKEERIEELERDAGGAQ